MKSENYQRLECQWTAMYPPVEFLEVLRREEAEYAVNPRAQIRRDRICDKLYYPVLQHLGYVSIEPETIRKEVETGVDLSLDYFLGSWWRPEAIDRAKLEEVYRKSRQGKPPTIVTPANFVDGVIDNNLRAMDKSHPERDLNWFAAYTSSLFLGGLTQRWDDLAKISSWFDATIEPEFTGGELEDEYQLVFLCIAGSLAPEPMERVDELLAIIKKCRTKRPRLLCAAWEAAEEGNQAAFNRAFPATVKHFLSQPAGAQAYDWVAIHQSSIWFIAERHGLKFPPLSDKEQAAVVTRDSAGLAD